MPGANSHLGVGNHLFVTHQGSRKSTVRNSETVPIDAMTGMECMRLRRIKQVGTDRRWVVVDCREAVESAHDS